MRIRNLLFLLAAASIPLLLVSNLQSYSSATTSILRSGHTVITTVADATAGYLYGSAGSPEAGWFPEAALPETAPPPPPQAALLSNNHSSLGPEPAWMAKSNLVFNEPARSLLRSGAVPPGETIHFTFGSIVMLDFVHNWFHHVRKANISPALIGAADVALLERCGAEGLAAVGVRPGLDPWTYAERSTESKKAFDLQSNWKYYRHHKSSFLEMGLVKAAFLWELLTAGYSVLISDLDVVWLTPHWRRWMAFGDPANPPLPEATLNALSDVLVSTDEINAGNDGKRGGFGFHSELNTGVLYFRCTPGSLAVVQAWRGAMMQARAHQFVNDQGIFNGMIHSKLGETVARSDASRLTRWANDLKAQIQSSKSRAQYTASDVDRALSFDKETTRDIHLSRDTMKPCLPSVTCEGVDFTIGTLPVRGFTNGHTWFNQNVQRMPGYELPQNEPVTVHFTFQFGDTQEYPHGKRQRAREAALWSVDPPKYFTEGVFVRLVGPLFTAEQQAAVEAKFPEWSPQRHMHMDAIQRAAVRDVLALATALQGIMIMPKLHCFCDRYWNWLTACRFPIGPRDMPVPFWCPQDALFDLVRWNTKGVKFREATFLENENVPPELVANKLRLHVHEKGSNGNSKNNASAVHVTAGTSMASINELVRTANPNVRVVEIDVQEIKKLCKWLGSVQANRNFNALSRYVLTDSSRYCPNEDHRGFGSWDWRNPFTAYNCTWGFHYPTVYPEEYPCERPDGGSQLRERSNSTTCPRQMLCGWNTIPSGKETGRITFCNIEGYGGMCSHDPSGGCQGAVDHMLSQMPDGRCPYPPGDVPGGGKGLDHVGNWVGS